MTLAMTQVMTPDAPQAAARKPEKTRTPKPAQPANKVRRGGRHSGSRSKSFDRAYAVLAEHGVPDKKLRTLRNEFARSQDRSAYMNGGRPDFAVWLKYRLEDRYYLCRKTVMGVKSSYGSRGVRLLEQFWKTQVALARVMRTSQNIRIVVLAGLWLQAASTDTLGTARELVRRGLRDDWQPYAIELEDERTIMTSPCPRGLRPLWLQVAESMFGSSIRHIDPVKLTKLVHAQRCEGHEDVAMQKGRLTASRILDFHEECGGLAWLFPILTQAVRLGLSSGDLLETEAQYVNQLKMGLHRPMQSVCPWGDFLIWMKKNIHREAVPSRAENRRRRNAVLDVPGGWLLHPPKEAADLSRQLYKPGVHWLDCALNKEIQPAEPHLDYFMFLIRETANLPESRRKKGRRQSHVGTAYPRSSKGVRKGLGQPCGSERPHGTAQQSRPRWPWEETTGSPSAPSPGGRRRPPDLYSSPPSAGGRTRLRHP